MDNDTAELAMILLNKLKISSMYRHKTCQLWQPFLSTELVSCFTPQFSISWLLPQNCVWSIRSGLVTALSHSFSSEMFSSLRSQVGLMTDGWMDSKIFYLGKEAQVCSASTLLAALVTWYDAGWPGYCNFLARCLNVARKTGLVLV